MEPTCAYRAHLAVTKVEYTKIMREERLDPKVFDFSPQLTYFKLFPSQEAAVKQALKSRTFESAKGALETTTFYVLTLYLTDEQ